jgi:hypothetical protein
VVDAIPTSIAEFFMAVAQSFGDSNRKYYLQRRR